MDLMKEKTESLCALAEAEIAATQMQRISCLNNLLFNLLCLIKINLHQPQLLLYSISALRHFRQILRN